MPAYTEDALRTLFHNANYSISNWAVQYAGSTLHTLTCDLRWPSQGSTDPFTPPEIQQLAVSVVKLTWKV